MVALKQGKLDTSADQFQQELSINPGYIPAEYQLGYVRLQMHQAGAAIPLLQDVVSRQPNHSDAHYELGKALLEQGKVKDAIQDRPRSTCTRPITLIISSASHTGAKGAPTTQTRPC
jgi:tetratricopeptide (TPR) repeat protein